MEKGYAIITGADGGMGMKITHALARKGYNIIMACHNPASAFALCNRLKKTSGNDRIEVRPLDLASLASVEQFTSRLLEQGVPVSRLINNAGVLTTGNRQTADGLETIVSVNYVGPYLLTRRLLPLMQPGARIINTVSCTYAIGKIEPCFFEKGCSGTFRRIPVYANTKLALLLFTKELAKRTRHKQITVNAADPGIVNTNMITMQAWFDPFTDLLFRPFIKTPAKGAATAIHLALSEEPAGKSGCCYASCRERNLSKRFSQHPQQEKLWEETEQLLERLGYRFS